VSDPLPARSVQLYGPGDIIGVDSKAIIRNEPRNWITNFEPNYIPFIEFYDEDFPWRYTPAKPSPDGRGKRPWLALVVLEESEFDDKSTDVLGRLFPTSLWRMRARSSRLRPVVGLGARACQQRVGRGDRNDTGALAQVAGRSGARRSRTLPTRGCSARAS